MPGGEIMYEIVNSDKKAISLRDRANIVAPKKVFCPLTKDQCQPDCVCFLKAKYRRTLGDVSAEWIIEGGYCDNHMFHGGE